MKKITALILAALMLLSAASFAVADTEPGFYDPDTGRIRMTHKRYIRPDFEDYDSFSKTDLATLLTVYLNAASSADKNTLVAAIIGAVMNGEIGRDFYFDFLDAEKYEVVGLEYDSNLCWAATAANMLWQSGYPQKCVSPYTGRPFESVDELFDYFRKAYPDMGGTPKEAILDFFFDYGIDSATFVYNLLADPSLFDKIGQLFTDGTFGAGIFGYDLITGEQVMAHAVTIVGVIVDETATTLDEKYIGVLIADSDTTPAIGNGYDLPLAPWERPRAAIASNRTDKVTYYPLQVVYVNGNPTWTIVGYLPDATVVIEDIYALPNL